MRTWFIVAASAWLGLGLGAGGARGGDWAAAVFPERSHDFGTVAKFSKVRHSFPVVNSTDQILHIKSWEAKCGCTDVRVGARDVPPGTQTTIDVTIDTTKFDGYKASGLWLDLDRPAATRISFDTTCFIRSDLTLTPGLVDFGVVNRSAGPKAELDLAYSGPMAGWAITAANTISEHVTATLTQQGARAGGGPAAYHLSVALNPTAPVGFFKDEITLRTNDPAGPTIPVSVVATVQSNVTVTPSVFNLGPVRPGEVVQKSFVVRSAQPFKVAAVESNRPELEAAPVAEEAKPLHALSFTFKAPATPGPFHATVSVQSDLKGEPPTKLVAFATVVP